jgi:hypothetical protein
MIPKSLSVDLELPVNSFQINTPHKAVIIQWAISVLVNQLPIPV